MHLQIIQVGQLQKMSLEKSNIYYVDGMWIGKLIHTELTCTNLQLFTKRLEEQT